ncbi:MAG: pilus assembly protein PilM [Deltaproteobacteria bacterium]|nr:pilus assembly protein PilM [Deltaproteobacteria bacterium]
MIFQTSLGIDIGDDELCLAFLKASSRDIQLAAEAVYPIPGGIHGEEKSKAVSELIKRFLGENRISPTSVFLGIPRGKAILRYLELPITVKENLRETLGYELEKYVPFSSEDVYFDFQIISEDKTTDRLRLFLVVVKKQTLSNVLAVSEDLGIGLSGVGITATALADYFSWRHKKDGGIAKSFIYACERNIELGLIKNGMIIYSRYFEQTEELIEAIPKALSKMRLDFVKGDEPLETILCGIEEGNPIMERLLQADGITLHPMNFPDTRIPSANFIPAYGLALKGVRTTPMDINLLPPAKRKKPSRLKVYTLIGLVFLVFLGALFWGGGILLQRQRTLDRLDGEIKKLGSEVKKLEQTQTAKKRMEERIDYLNTLRKGGLPVLDVLKELSERIPKTAWLKSFNFSGKGIEIQGYALSASELIQILDASPMFVDVKFLSSINKDRTGMERFRIGLILK